MHYSGNFPGKEILKKIANKFLPQPSGSVIIKTIYGFDLEINPQIDKGIEECLFKTGTYEEGTLHIFNQILKEGDVVVDAGANIGLMSIFAAQIVGGAGQVHAFEPEPNTFKILQKNCALNNLTNIVLNEQALGAEKSEAMLYSNMNINRGAASLIQSEDATGTNVLISTLDIYVEEQKLTKIDFIKIDIEGFELEMLKGSSKLLAAEHAPILCVEYSQTVARNNDLEDVYDFIKKINNYRIYKFQKSKAEIGKLTEVLDKKDLPVHDNIFCFLEEKTENVVGFR